MTPQFCLFGWFFVKRFRTTAPSNARKLDLDTLVFIVILAKVPIPSKLLRIERRQHRELIPIESVGA